MYPQVKASDEMFFPCCLAILGLIPPEQPPQQPKQQHQSLQSIQSSQSSSEQDPQLHTTNVVLQRQLTYCVWGQVCRCNNQHIIYPKAYLSSFSCFFFVDLPRVIAVL